MKVIRSINHNAAVGVDSLGREVVVMGAGVGFGKLPREIPLSQIDRTFVGVDDKYLGLIDELPYEQLAFSAQFSDLVRMQVSYELSPNLAITLADHISFMLKRAREGMYVSMPLAYDVSQMYPVEYRLGKLCVQGAQKTFGVKLPRGEAVGIALSIVGSAVASSNKTTRSSKHSDRVVDRVTKVVERHFGIEVDRESFDYARFATHVRYLLDRLEQGSPLKTPNSTLYEETKRQYPQVSACADEAIDLICPSGGVVTNDERLYLMLHINRLRERAAESIMVDE